MDFDLLDFYSTPIKITCLWWHQLCKSVLSTDNLFTFKTLKELRKCFKTVKRRKKRKEHRWKLAKKVLIIHDASPWSSLNIFYVSDWITWRREERFFPKVSFPNEDKVKKRKEWALRRKKSGKENFYQHLAWRKINCEWLRKAHHEKIFLVKWRRFSSSFYKVRKDATDWQSR